MAVDIQSPTDTTEAIADAGLPRVQPPGGEPSRDVLDEARTKAWYRRASKAGAQSLKNADGTSSSLRTTSIERDGTHYLFPTIRELDGELIEMSLEDAEAKAFELGDYLTFASAEEATAASQLISDSLGEMAEAEVEEGLVDEPLADEIVDDEAAAVADEAAAGAAGAAEDEAMAAAGIETEEEFPIL